MHHIATKRIAAQNIRHNLAKCLGKQAFVNVPDGIVNIFFGSRNPSADISLVAVHFGCENTIFSLAGKIKDKGKRIKAKVRNASFKEVIKNE